MAVGPEAQVNEVQDRPRAGKLLQGLGVRGGRGLQVRRFHGHGMDFARRNGVGPSRHSRKWVRFRSAWPAGATRSSTCATSTSSQGTCWPARARSMSQGVRPPLRAARNRPRAATAARASAARILGRAMGDGRSVG